MKSAEQHNTFSNKWPWITVVSATRYTYGKSVCYKMLRRDFQSRNSQLNYNWSTYVFHLNITSLIYLWSYLCSFISHILQIAKIFNLFWTNIVIFPLCCLFLWICLKQKYTQIKFQILTMFYTHFNFTYFLCVTGYFSSFKHISEFHLKKFFIMLCHYFKNWCLKLLFI